MGSSVSVESAAIQGGIGCCRTSIHELEGAAKSLQRSYQQAGSGGWNDQKYAKLGNIVEECCNALTKPISGLQECLVKLNDLLQAVSEYEQTSIGTSTSNGNDDTYSQPASGISHSAQVMSCASGEYHYEVGENNSRHAFGQLRLVPQSERHRNQTAQSSAGGERRRSDDDGGHLIGARFGGSANSENLFPQNLHLNRSGYRTLESEWANLLENNNQVFVDIYTSASNDQMREDAIYGSYTVISPNGRRYTEGFSFANENAETQASWEEDVFINT